MSQDKVQYLCLVIMTSPKGERAHLVEKSPFVIGRSTDCDILYAHANASRQHLEVSFDGPKITVKDLKSANGTFLNMQKMDFNREVPYNSGDRIILGTGDIEIQLKSFARPVELGNLDHQKSQMKKALAEVISGLTQTAALEFESGVKKELEARKKSAMEDMQTQVTREYETIRQQQTAQIEAMTMKLKAENRILEENVKAQQRKLDQLNAEATDILSNARKSAHELTETTQALADQTKRSADELLYNAKRDSDQLLSSSRTESEQLLASSRAESESLLTNSKNESESLLSNSKAESESLLTNTRRESEEMIAKAKAETEEIVNRRYTEADKLMETTQAEANELLATTKKQTDEQLASTHSTAEGILAEARAKMQEMRVKAHVESREMVTKAKAEAETLSRESKYEIEHEKRMAEVSLREEFESARKAQLSQLEQNRVDLIVEIQRLEAEIQVKSIQARAAVDKMAAQFLQESQERIAKQEQEAGEKVAALLRQAHTKFLETTNDAQKRSDEILGQARREAAEMRKMAQEESSKTRARAFEQAELHLQEAKKETEEHVTQLLAESTERLKLQEQEMVKQAEIEAEKRQIEIANDHKEQILKLKKQLEALKLDTQKLLHDKQQAQVQTQAKSEELRVVTEGFNEKAREFQTLLAKVEQAEAIMAAAAAAKKEQEAIESEIRKLNFYQEQIQTKQDERLKGQEDELKKQKEQLLLAHSEHLKALEGELNQKRLKAMDDIKRQIDIEEFRVKEIRKQQASELARLVEVRVNDRIQTFVTDAKDQGALSQAVFTAVRDTLANDEASLKPLTVHLDEAKKVEDIKRKKISKWAVRGSAATAALLLVFNYEHLMSYFKSQEGHSVAQQMIEQRKIQSIYQPEQTTEFRDSYMDNILYLKNYFEVMSNKDFQQQWTLKLNDVMVVKEFGVTEEQMIKFYAIESNLVAELFKERQQIDAVYLSEGLERLRKTEETEKARMLEQLKTDRNLKRILVMEKEAIEKFLKSHPGQFP